jgi:spore germination protein
MHRNAPWFSLAVAVGLAVLPSACVARSANTDPTFSPRRTTVIYEGCTLSDRDDSTLAGPAARVAIQEIVLSCASLQPSGDVTPALGPARDALIATVRTLQGRGYRVTVAVRALDSAGKLWDATSLASFLADPTRRASSIGALVSLSQNADGLEIAIPPISLPNSARANLTTWITGAARAIRPARTLGLFAPPSTSSPSDVAGGDAYDFAALGPAVDRVRVMTLDYSCCGAAPGPGTDSTWAIAAATFVGAQIGSTPMDVALPLYGTDFTSAGVRYLSWVEAIELCGNNVDRSVGPHCRVRDGSGVSHEVWFDDQHSIASLLAQLSPDVLRPDVGVTLYGLGAEDPALWLLLAHARQP